MPKSSPSLRFSKHTLGLIVLTLAAVLLPLIGLTSALMYLQDTAAWLRQAGWWTWPLFVFIAGLVIGVAVAPSHATSLMAGYIYGIAGGTFAALTAVATGTAVGFAISRSLTQDQLRQFIDRSRWGRLLARELIDAPTRRAFFAVALARLPPQVPFALGNVLAASCRVKLLALLGGTLLGMAPRVILVVWMGSELAVWQPGAPAPTALYAAVATTLIGFGGLALWSWRLLRKR